MMLTVSTTVVELVSLVSSGSTASPAPPTSSRELRGAGSLFRLVPFVAFLPHPNPLPLGEGATPSAPCLVRHATASSTLPRSAQRGPIGHLSQRERVGVREKTSNHSSPPFVQGTSVPARRLRVRGVQRRTEDRHALPSALLSESPSPPPESRRVICGR